MISLVTDGKTNNSHTLADRNTLAAAVKQHDQTEADWLFLARLLAFMTRAREAQS